MREVAEQVFAELGDYGRILPTWLVHDGVLTQIAEEDGVAVGYTMLGFYTAGPTRQHEYVADLLAIAVSPRRRGAASASSCSITPSARRRWRGGDAGDRAAPVGRRAQRARARLFGSSASDSSRASTAATTAASALHMARPVKP